MNILHMKYAAEVAKEGSLSKAAQKLIIAQSNISRAIKELEADGTLMELATKYGFENVLKVSETIE